MFCVINLPHVPSGLGSPLRSAPSTPATSPVTLRHFGNLMLPTSCYANAIHSLCPAVRLKHSCNASDPYTFHTRSQRSTTLLGGSFHFSPLLSLNPNETPLLVPCVLLRSLTQPLPVNNGNRVAGVRADPSDFMRSLSAEF